MKKLRFIPQLESNDCGPACLAMVASYHGKFYAPGTIRELCGVTRMGVSVQDILDGGTKMGFEAAALKLTVKELEEIALPAILCWKEDQFVVLYKIRVQKNRKFYHLADPAYGKVRLEGELFEREWLGNENRGVAIVLRPGQFQLPGKLNGSAKRRWIRPCDAAELTHGFIRAHRFRYAFAYALLLFGLTANWLLPVIFKKIIDEGIMSRSITLVWALVLAQFALFVGNFSAQFISDLILTRLNFKLGSLLKQGFLEKLIRLPVSYFDTRLNTDTLQRLSDLGKVQTFLTWKGLAFLISVLNFIVFSLILLYMNRLVFGIFLILTAVSILWVGYFLKRRATLEYSRFIQQSENNNILYEFIMNMPEIKLNRTQDTIIKKVGCTQKKLNRLDLQSLFLNMYQMAGANFILRLKELIIIAVCAYLIINSRMTIGTMLSICYILGQVCGPIISIIDNIRDAQDANISNKRVEDVYNVGNEIDRHNMGYVPLVHSGLHLQNVCFKYPGSFNPFVLEGVSFDIPQGKTTAIVGSSGSGKTTLMKLLLAYYLPQSGEIFFKPKRKLSEINPDHWRGKCGVVLQDGHVFSGTIVYNITLSDSDRINVDRLNQAIQVACLGDFINELPMGLYTKIGSVGMQLSGGQKQRILIARAVYKDPKFVFFDEAISSLDTHYESEILKNLDEFFKGRSVVIISHRLRTVRNADQIVVLDKGRIIETGTHAELVSERGKYFSLVKGQLESES